MALPAKNSRDRLTLARQALDGPTEAQLSQAGGGGTPYVVTDSMRDMGNVPDEIASTFTGPEPTILTGEPGAGGGGTTYSSDAKMPDENGEGGVSGEREGGVTSGDFDEAAADFNWSLLDQALQGVDTSEEEAQMQGQQDRMMGQALMDQRASMGASGFGESGAMMALEGDTRSDAARQLGLDISGLRREEAQQAIENAIRAQGIDIEKMKAADQARLNELIASFMMNDGELPPEGGGEGGGGATPIDAVSGALGDETTPFGKGTGQSELAAAPDPSGYDTRDAHDEADLFIENYTDPDGKTWSVYRTPNGDRYRVPMGA